jgi:glycosyltransferase involved in cell wall biosynthesis
MRILIGHNAYQQRGGEDAVVQAEHELLRAHGHDVRLFSRHNDEVAGIDPVALATQTLWSRPSAQALAAMLSDWRPDVVHLHNTFPLISPAAYWACAAAKVPVVQTLHNFRLLCPQAMFLREERVCEDCLGRLPWRGAVRACYHGSRTRSAVVASMIVLHRGLGTWRRKVTRYIALNEFCRAKFVAGALPPERVVVKPNFIDCDAPPEGARDGLLFVGRLSVEKGVGALAQAAPMAGVPLCVAGSGPQAALLQGAPGVQMLGMLAPEAVYGQMAQARALVLPSLWYECFPRTVVEAFANGLPVIASRLGALPELVHDGRTGLLFDPGDPADMARKMRWAQTHAQEMAAMGRNARARYEAEFTGRRNHDLLMAIYQGAIDEVSRSH